MSEENLLKEHDKTLLEYQLRGIIMRAFLRGFDASKHPSEENITFIENLSKSSADKIMKNKSFKIMT